MDSSNFFSFLKINYKNEKWVIISGIILFLLSFIIKTEVITPLLILFVVLITINFTFTGAIISVIYSVFVLAIQGVFVRHVTFISYLADVLVIVIAGFFIITREANVRRKNRELRERVKELNCLYSISKIVEQDNLTLEEILQKIIEIIPPSWQFPEDTCVRLLLSGTEYRTERFKKTKWMQSSDIIVNGENKGRLEVYYLNRHPGEDEGPFLKEERDLIEAITGRLANILVSAKQGRELLESRNFLAITLNSIGDAVIVTDKKGIIIRMNKIAEKLTGWNIKEAIGKEIYKVFNIINSKTREPVYNPVKKVLKEGKVTGLANHTKLIAKDGKEYHIADSAAPIKDKDGNMYGVVMVFRNYTKQYYMQEEIKRRENLFSTAINRAPYPVMIHADDGEVIKINDTWTELSGYSQEDIPTISDWFLKAYGRKSKIIKKQINDLYNGKGVYNSGEYIITTKNGEKKIWDFNFAVLGTDPEGKRLMISIAKDTTNHKSIEDRIKKLNHIYLLLSEVNKAIVHIRDQEKLFRKTCEIIVNKGEYKSVWIAKLNENRDKMNIIEIGGVEKDYLQDIDIKLTEKENNCPVVLAVKSGNNFISNNIKKDKRISPCSREINKNKFTSVAVFPLKVFNKVWGVFVLHVNEMGHFDKEEIKLLDELTDDLSYAIESINNERQREEFEQKLTESEKKYRNLFTKAPVGIFRTTSSGKPLLVNPEMARILGCKSPLDVLNYYEDLQNMLYVNPQRRGEFIEKITKRGYVENFIYRAYRKDGNQIWIKMNARISEMNDNGSFIIDGFAEDITEKQKVEEKMLHMTFHDKLTDLYNRAYLEEEMKRIDTGRQLPISIIMGDLNNLKLVNDTYGHEEGDKLLIKISEIIKESCRSEDVVGRWGGDEFVILLPNTPLKIAENICKRINERCDNNPRELLMSIALGCASKEEVNEEIIEVLNRAEDRMYKNKLANRKSARSNVLNAFLTTLREKSFETEEHASRMKKMSLALGKKINLTSVELDKLSLLTLLHDIGKVVIPEEILNKPGKLTKEEWKLIKTHPEAGYRIASSMEEFADIADGILHHHERWDGEGYPERIAEEKIPLLARVLAIVDSFDVMISGRPYKPPMSIKEAIFELKKCAGSQFDPRLVEIFINLIKNENILGQN